MNCPACHEPLIVLEQDAVEIDYCDTCKGIWLDRGELELLFNAPQAATMFLETLMAANDTKESLRKCPICGYQMDKVITSGVNAVLLDRCRRGHGLWLDQGELNRILSPDTNPSHLAAFLCSIFAFRESSPQ